MHKDSENIDTDSKVRSDSDKENISEILSISCAKRKFKFDKWHKVITSPFPFLLIQFLQGPNFPKKQIRFTANTKIASFIYKAKNLANLLFITIVCPVILAFIVVGQYYITLVISVGINR